MDLASGAPTRGSLRIYLGAAPGVGKTYAMLNEGRRRAERGTDVVVALVETHQRANTAAQLDGLEVLPRRTLQHRGTTFEELDLDAVLARRPRIALVDELAHTNTPGSRHEKRWQDIDTLLDAGIDVISTVNIQHLESLNDVVERITGVTQRETVPDVWVRRADQIELVDMTPEALRRRMAHGNIYPAERIDAALGHYFRPGNLAALRELALLWLADRVEVDLQSYMEAHGIDHPWETRERVVVALTGAPGGDVLIRRAARIARRARGDLIGVHVVPADGLAAEGAQDELDRHRTLLGELGGTYRSVVGDDVGAALVTFARAERATQVVLGASGRSRWREAVQGSVVSGVLRSAGEMDVHVISTTRQHREAAGLPRTPPPQRRRRGEPLPRRRQVAAWLLILLGLPLLTAALLPNREAMSESTSLVAFLVAVVVVTAVGGSVPGLVAAVVGFALDTFYLLPPYGTPRIGNIGHALSLVVFVSTAIILSVLLGRLAERSREAQRARAEAEALARGAADLAGGTDAVAHLVEEVRAAFQLDAVAVLQPTGARWEVVAAAGEAPPQAPSDGDAIALADGASLVLVGGDLQPDDRRVLNAFAAQLAVAIEARRLEAELSAARTSQASDALRTAILQAVSHDLRTPLASIKASVTSLLQDDVAWPPEATEEFLHTIDEEADRLNRLVGNLLDMSRIQAGALSMTTRVVGLDEVVPVALASLSVDTERVVVEVGEHLPRVRVDPGLLERAVANVVGNALAWTPLERGVRVEAGAVGGRVLLRIVDHGPGIPLARREDVFAPFQRLGDQPAAAGLGVGLGLAVARGFVRAMGGELHVEDTPGGGTTVVIELPIADPAPTRTSTTTPA